MSLDARVIERAHRQMPAGRWFWPALFDAGHHDGRRWLLAVGHRAVKHRDLLEMGTAHGWVFGIRTPRDRPHAG